MERISLRRRFRNETQRILPKVAVPLTTLFGIALGIAETGCVYFPTTEPEKPTSSATALSKDIPPSVTPFATPLETPTAIVPTHTAKPTRLPFTPTVVVEPTAEAKRETLFAVLMKPFEKEAERLRTERAKVDPEFVKRVDGKLNKGRVNILLFGYGETHEPPVTEKAIVGSHTIVSFDTSSGKVDFISLTHDIRGPEIEIELEARGQKTSAVRIDQAYNVGGFRLMRRTLENATGLSLDFQITFKDIVIQKVIDEVFGGIEVDVPEAFSVQPFYLEGKKYPEGFFPKGKQRLNGTQVIQFIKTVPKTVDYYGKSLEHNVRKYLIFQSLLEAIQKNAKDREFWLKTLGFFAKELLTGNIVYDFDAASLVINNLQSLVGGLEKFAATGEKVVGFPPIDKEIYIVDPCCSKDGGGVRWVDGDSNNPFTKRDIEAGVYRHGMVGIQVPFNANALGDLVTEYWPSVRTLIREVIIGKNTPTPAPRNHRVPKSILVRDTARIARSNREVLVRPFYRQIYP